MERILPFSCYVNNARFGHYHRIKLVFLRKNKMNEEELKKRNVEEMKARGRIYKKGLKEGKLLQRQEDVKEFKEMIEDEINEYDFEASEEIALNRELDFNDFTRSELRKQLLSKIGDDSEVEK
jgi:hypothetical protein